MAADGPGETLARYYDLDLVDDRDDVSLYLALAARTGGPVLELAAGTGRIAVPLAEAGHAVTAVDVDAYMLARARSAWAGRTAAAGTTARRSADGLEFVEADIRDLRLEKRFALVILALNTLLMLPGREAQAAALRTMAHHLTPTGRAVVDVWLPTPEDLVGYDGRVTLEWVRDDADRDESVAKVSAARYDPPNAAAIVDSLFDSWPNAGGAITRTARRDTLHFVSAAELRILAEGAGMRVETVGGDHAMSDFGQGSERVVLVCALL